MIDPIHCRECGSDITDEGFCFLCAEYDPLNEQSPSKDHYIEGLNDGLNDQTASHLTGKYLSGYREGQRRRLSG